MGIVHKIIGGRRVTEIVEAVRALDEVMPRLPEPAEAPKPAPKKPGDAKLVRGLGERLGAAGLLAVTLGAAAFGLAACLVPGQLDTRLPSAPPPVQATCDEPASWCHRGDAAEARQR